MEERAFERYQCWKEERISQVINKEAVSIEKANFLATHAPLNSIMYERTPQEMIDKSEQGLLHELRRCATEQRHTFAVVQGIPGTGKSHLIRWLKESYAVADKENQGNDVILLIERAQCNLRGTLLQIIESGIFEDATMHPQLEKLKGATTELSKNALEDTILDQLRVATSEVVLPDEHLPRLFIRKRIEKFLLDFYVRQELKKLGGPVDRITRYLSVGDTSGIGDHEIPGFVASDFKFGIDTLYAIKNEGYKEARDLAEKLHDPDELDLRQELAQYLNRLLNYAIGRTTALSTDDLKQMFNELRRHLRKQNRQLALFIEDITAFTGLDVGLIDVLATQHTGESNREFCRLLSVIGITDNYFNDHFPDNMRERVTHRLTLNATQQGLVESDLLRTPRSTADMAARYLNAMRLEQAALDSWFEDGARPERLPNACNTCQFKPTCHDAFGFVELASDEASPQRVGLYPFNEHAIWTMYQGITTTTRTPRSLLNSVLEYVLESHGKKVSRGDFPPPSRELGNDFKAPPLVKLSHRSIIDLQGGKDAKRIESLVLFWGTGTVDTTVSDQHHLVGGLPEAVFRAFDIPFIEGEDSVHLPNLSNVGVSPSSHSVTEHPTSYIHSPVGASPGILPVSPVDSIPRNYPNIQKNQTGTPTVEPRQNKYTKDINDWLNGDKLQNYEKLGDLLVTLIGSFIDWEAHGISALEVDNRLRRARMAIEDQVGRITNANDCFIFKRSPKLAAVLQALGDIGEGINQQAPSTLGGHLASLSSWLYENESLIVDFMRRPTSQSTETMALTTLLFINCILLACLQGELEHKTYSPQELLLLIITHCAKADTTNWQSYIDEAQKIHGRTWVDLMRGVDNKKNNVRICRRSLLQMLNKAQGDSQDVRFIDAALALDTLQAFEQSGWALSPIEAIGASASPAWLTAYEVYSALFKHFTKALTEDREAIEGYIRRLGDLIGSSDPKEVFQAINEWINHMKQSQKSYRLEPKPSLNATRLSKVKSTFEAVIKEQNPKRLALRLSDIGPTVKDAQEHLQYFQDFRDEVSRQKSQSQQSLTQLRTEVGTAPLSLITEQVYIDIEHILTQTIEATKEMSR